MQATMDSPLGKILLTEEAGALVRLEFVERAVDILLENTCICGNFDPVEVMLQGTTETMKAEVRRCKKLGKRNNNFIAPGCEVPKDTPPENMLALLAALEEDANEI